MSSVWIQLNKPELNQIIAEIRRETKQINEEWMNNEFWIN